MNKENTYLGWCMHETLVSWQKQAEIAYAKLAQKYQPLMLNPHSYRIHPSWPSYLHTGWWNPLMNQATHFDFRSAFLPQPLWDFPDCFSDFGINLGRYFIVCFSIKRDVQHSTRKGSHYFASQFTIKLKICMLCVYSLHFPILKRSTKQLN